MDLLLKTIFEKPFALLGIFFMIIGAASLLFKVFNITEPGNRYVKKNEEKKNSKKALLFVLIAIVIGLIFFIYWLRK